MKRMFGRTASPRSIHFQVDGLTQIHTVLPLAREAIIRELTVSIGTAAQARADVGFYIGDLARPGNQKFTVRSINGLDQDHAARPNYAVFFEQEMWSSFDLGILPGPRWMRGFESQPFHPRFGAQETGWPKADTVLPLNRGSTVVYAPQISSFSKVEQTVKAMRKVRESHSLNLLVKHWETREYQRIHPWLITDELLEELDAAEKSLPEWATAAPRTKNFMDCLSGAAAVVTDQSSVMYEALLVPVPSISVVDWKHACGDCLGPQPSPDAVITTESAELAEALIKVLSGDKDIEERTLLLAEDNFSFMGSSAKQTLDVIMSTYGLKIGRFGRK